MGRYQLVTVGYESRVKIWKKQGFRIQFLTGLSYWKFDRDFVSFWQGFRIDFLHGFRIDFDRAFVPLLQGEDEGEGESSEDDDGERLEEKKIISLYMNEHKLKQLKSTLSIRLRNIQVPFFCTSCSWTSKH